MRKVSQYLSFKRVQGLALGVIIALPLATGCKPRVSSSGVQSTETDAKAIFEKVIYNAGTSVGTIQVYPTERITQAARNMAMVQSLEQAYAKERSLNAFVVQKIWAAFQQADQETGAPNLEARLNAVRKTMTSYTIKVPDDKRNKPVAMVLMKYLRNAGGTSSQMINMGIKISNTQLVLNNSVVETAGAGGLNDPDWAAEGFRQLGQETEGFNPEYESFLDQEVTTGVDSQGNVVTAETGTINRNIISAIFYKWGEYLNYLGVGLLGVQDDFRFTKLIKNRPGVDEVRFSAEANMDEILTMEVRLLYDDQYQELMDRNPMLKPYESNWQ